jgi:hypothetical protein
MRVSLAAAGVLLLAACRVPSAGFPDPLPPIPVYEIRTVPDSGVVITRVPGQEPFASSTRRITLTATDASARTLLIWLAQEAGMNLVVAPDVNARISVNFRDVPADVAMRAIIAEAGLSVLTAANQPLWAPVVFHQPPVNVNEATAESIVARFGVSAELARWIVESRPRP